MRADQRRHWREKRRDKRRRISFFVFFLCASFVERRQRFFLLSCFRICALRFSPNCICIIFAFEILVCDKILRFEFDFGARRFGDRNFYASKNSSNERSPCRRHFMCVILCIGRSHSNSRFGALAAFALNVLADNSWAAPDLHCIWPLSRKIRAYFQQQKVCPIASRTRTGSRVSMPRGVRRFGWSYTLKVLLCVGFVGGLYVLRANVSERAEQFSAPPTRKTVERCNFSR